MTALATNTTLVRLDVAIFQTDRERQEVWRDAIARESKLHLLQVCESMYSARCLLKYGKPDSIVLDSSFPDGCAAPIVQEIKAHLPNCSVTVVSDDADELMALKCIEAGATGYFLHDVAGDGIAKTILDLHSGGNPMSPEIAHIVMERARSKAGQIPVEINSNQSLLTKRESAILCLIARGKSDKVIGQALGISYLTAQTHTKNIYRKLNVNSRTEAIFKARLLGIES